MPYRSFIHSGWLVPEPVSYHRLGYRHRKLACKDPKRPADIYNSTTTETPPEESFPWVLAADSMALKDVLRLPFYSVMKLL